MNIEAQIKVLEEEIRNTPYNKKTQHHIGRLKARLAKLKAEIEKRKTKTSAVKKGIRKSGDGTVLLIGPPSTGKTTLFTKLTNVGCTPGEYGFATVDVKPGMLNYNGAKIQILDTPSILEYVSEPSRKEVLGIARNVDLILILLDVYNTSPDTIMKELNHVGIRLNRSPPKIVLKVLNRGGIVVNTTVKLKSISIQTVEAILREYNYVNAEIIIREDITSEDLIDFLSGNKVYIPGLLVLNKVDLVESDTLEHIEEELKRKGWSVIFISVKENGGLEILKKEIYKKLALMKVYLKDRNGNVDFKEPLILKENSTVEDVCEALHKDFKRKFKHALIWGDSAKFPAQKVGLEHTLKDGDILTIVLRT